MLYVFPFILGNIAKKYSSLGKSPIQGKVTMRHQCKKIDKVKIYLERVLNVIKFTVGWMSL